MNSSQLPTRSSDEDVLPELRDQGGEVGVPRDEGEAVHVLLGVGQVHRVDHHPDVGRVLAAVAALGDVDQLDGVLVEGALVLRVPVPVRVGPLDHDLALLDQALQDQLDLELLVLRFLDPADDVLEVHEHRQLPVVTHAFHPSCCRLPRRPVLPGGPMPARSPILIIGGPAGGYRREFTAA
jgi:hypothetical protein